ncbi:MAG: D-alanyl-D-alanine carboxypeptidase [Rhodospirillales bacterium]|nr:D-alanyl-D-alanine carboxypeptidase [Rhodospirillales bacterium]
MSDDQGHQTRIRRLAIFRFVLVALAAAVISAGLTASPAYAKYAALVMDADSGRILNAVNADTRNYPASLTKMMTLYLVFDALERKVWTPDTPLKVSARAARQPASKLGLPAGSRIAVRDAILALVTKSANDIATTIAEGMDKSERDFGLRMTSMARKLGMKNTTFRNASGLFHRGQMSTARDMAILARALLRDFPQYYHFFSTPSFTYNGQTHRNHNGLLDSYDGVDGIKTGYISASGFNLAASAVRDGRRLIGVVFGGRSAAIRNRQMARLLDSGFAMVADGSAATEVAETAPPPTKPDTAVASVDPAEATPSAAAGNWAVQVGAYRRQEPAIEAARMAIEKVPSLLGEGIIKIVPLKKKKHTLYRARIAGFDKDRADTACRSLEREGVPCLVVSMKGVQLASNP